MDRLKVLFYVPGTMDAIDIHHELTTMLAHSLNDYADVERWTSAHGKDLSALKDYHIVHVFGSWNKTGIHFLGKAKKLHVPTVFTPLGGLQPWIIKKHKTARLFAQQQKVAQQASAIHVCGKLEYETFLKLGWNNKVTIIKNPVLTSQVSFHEMAQQMATLYQKVLDSNARLLLSEQSCSIIGQLLALGIDKEILNDHELCTEIKQQIENIPTVEWRKIFIYTNDEFIDLPVKIGLQRLQYMPPHIVVEEIDRFSDGHQYNEGDLKSDDTYSRNILLRNKISDAIASKEKKERRLMMQLLNLRYEIERHKAPLLHLANIYQSCRYDEMDEDRLKEMARDIGINDFAERLMTVLEEVLGLREGFMPFNQKDDRQAEALTKAITKYNT